MRRRFQKGNIIIRGKTPQRYGMYREDVLQIDGTFKRYGVVCCLARSVVYQNVQAAKLFQPYLDRANAAANTSRKSGMTLEAFRARVALQRGSESQG